MDTKITVEEIIEKCGPIISRAEAAKLSGGLLAEKTLINYDSLGIGPKERVKLGKRSGYLARSFAEWLLARLELRSRDLS